MEEASSDSQAPDDHGRRRRQQRVSCAPVKGRASKTGGRAQAADHGLPPAARHQQVEQDRASSLLLHHHQLAGKPLRSYRTIVQLIAATTTDAGLLVRAELDEKKYPKGVKVSDLQMAAINLTRHSFHGDWNYTISPHRKNHRPKRID
jgi:hypothetical protein